MADFILADRPNATDAPKEERGSRVQWVNTLYRHPLNRALHLLSAAAAACEQPGDYLSRAIVQATSCIRSALDEAGHAMSPPAAREHLFDVIGIVTATMSLAREDEDEQVATVLGAAIEFLDQATDQIEAADTEGTLDDWPGTAAELMAREASSVEVRHA